MQDTARQARMKSQATFSYGPLHMDAQVLVGYQELTSNCCADTGCSLDDLLWAIDDGGTNGETVKSVLAGWLDDDF